MKISKAIEIICTMLDELPLDASLLRRGALTLSLQALERHRDRDYTTYAGMHEPLPGETSNDKPA